MLNNIVDSLEQCGQHNIVQCCFHQARTGCAFFAVYMEKLFVPYEYNVTLQLFITRPNLGANLIEMSSR